jgi:hypothetical protein
MDTTRNDIHRPSEIIPSNYQYVAVWTMNIQGLGDCEFILREREQAKAHMAKTGGQLRHYANGSCGVCGNVQAIYLVLFHHAISNEYIVVGMNCAEKLDLGCDFTAMQQFKRNCADARDQQAGKRKAIALLSDAGMIDAWEVGNTSYPQHAENCKSIHGFGHGFECDCDAKQATTDWNQFPEKTIRDIVGKLVRYGSISPKQMDFVGKLLKQIADRPIIEAQRQAERDAAGPVPTGRATMKGIVLAVKEVQTETSFHYGDDGVRWKLLIKLENGSKVYGSRFDNHEKGDAVFFTATVEASKDDPKFGFYSRPRAAQTEEEIAQAKAEKKQAKQDAKLFSTIAWA